LSETGKKWRYILVSLEDENKPPFTNKTPEERSYNGDRNNRHYSSNKINERIKNTLCNLHKGDNLKVYSLFCA
jgi:hypothetical protein